MFRVDLALLKKVAHAGEAVLASEEDLFEQFPQCETGAMPPFGNLYGMNTFADGSLAQDKEICFNAGSHRELIRMTWEDYKRLAAPMVANLAAGRRSEAA